MATLGTKIKWVTEANQLVSTYVAERDEPITVINGSNQRIGICFGDGISQLKDLPVIRSGSGGYEKEVHRATTAPEDTAKLWIDTSVTPNLWKRWDSMLATPAWVIVGSSGDGFLKKDEPGNIILNHNGNSKYLDISPNYIEFGQSGTPNSNIIYFYQDTNYRQVATWVELKELGLWVYGGFDHIVQDSEGNKTAVIGYNNVYTESTITTGRVLNGGSELLQNFTTGRNEISTELSTLRSQDTESDVKYVVTILEGNADAASEGRVSWKIEELINDVIQRSKILTFTLDGILIDGINILIQVDAGIPATATSTGVKGQRVYDSTNALMYECVATDTWIRYAVTQTW